MKEESLLGEVGSIKDLSLLGDLEYLEELGEEGGMGMGTEGEDESAGRTSVGIEDSEWL